MVTRTFPVLVGIVLAAVLAHETRTDVCEASTTNCANTTHLNQGISFTQKRSLIQKRAALTEDATGDPVEHTGYKIYAMTTCASWNGGASDIGPPSGFSQETNLSCAAKCDQQPTCTGFLFGGLDKKDKVGECHLKKDVVLSNCSSIPHWDFYKKPSVYIERCIGVCPGLFITNYSSLISPVISTGSGGLFDVVVSSPNLTKKTCQELCDDTFACKAFMYRKGENTCALFSSIRHAENCTHPLSEFHCMEKQFKTPSNRSAIQLAALAFLALILLQFCACYAITSRNLPKDDEEEARRTTAEGDDRERTASEEGGQTNAAADAQTQRIPTEAAFKKTEGALSAKPSMPDEADTAKSTKPSRQGQEEIDFDLFESGSDEEDDKDVEADVPKAVQ